MQRMVVIPYGRFGTICRPHFEGATLEGGTDGLSRNIGKKLTTVRCVIPRRAQISSVAIVLYLSATVRVGS